MSPTHDGVVSFLLTLLKEALVGEVGCKHVWWVGKHKMNQQLGERQY